MINLASDATLLRTEELSCGYTAHTPPVLAGVNLSLRSGRLVCIIGPNGAGKTTLIRTLSGLLPSLSGRVLLDGKSVPDMRVAERARKLSIVLTSLRAPGYLTVRRFVELGRYPFVGLLGRLRDEDHRAVDEALEQTGIAALGRRWITEISDGERQRASVARALAQSADVMVLDEPTAFLDVAGRATLMTTMKRIAHETNRLIITTSHDIDLVLRTADLVVIIHHNGAVSPGSPEDIVLRGELDHLFQDGALRFDRATGTFRLPDPTGPAVRVVGTGEIAGWTRHALERIGLTVVDTDAAGICEAAGITVTVPDHADGVWSVETRSATETRGGTDRGNETGSPATRRLAGSIAELAEMLRD